MANCLHSSALSSTSAGLGIPWTYSLRFRCCWASKSHTSRMACCRLRWRNLSWRISSATSATLSVSSKPSKSNIPPPPPPAATSSALGPFQDQPSLCTMPSSASQEYPDALHTPRSGQGCDAGERLSGVVRPRSMRGSTSETCMRRSATGKLANVMVGAKSVDGSDRSGGRCAWWSTASWEYIFDITIGVAIILNCLSIGISTDTADWWAWPFIDMSFAVVFTVEILMKFRFVGVRMFFVGQGSLWNMFDLMVVVLAWLECGFSFSNTGGSTEGLSTLRILRMTRVARILRVCKLSVFADLSMMINGAVGSMRTFFWSQIILAIPLYMVAVLMRDSLGNLQVEGAGTEYFNTLFQSYFTSFRCLVAGECSTKEGEPIFVLVTKRFGWLYAAIYCFMTVLMTFALFNVIVAIFVENTITAAKANELRQKQFRLTDSRMFHRKAMELVDLIYEYEVPYKEFNWDAPDLEALMEEVMMVQLSRESFDELVQLERFQQVLHAMDINVAEQLDLFDTLDIDGGGTIDMEELITGIYRLRGDARRSDIVGTYLRVQAIQEGFAAFQEQVSDHFAVIRAALNVPEEDQEDIGALPSLRKPPRATRKSIFGRTA
mmetsp:Transcript_20684/g.59062  ORF Transcript_20684/g.59062 Transcript_20684/m.59062 type:complete len:606 (-) Transcript_20684:91-1908(-)